MSRTYIISRMDVKFILLLLVLPACILQKTTGQNLDGCDETKGCFKSSDGCTGDDCTAYVTWQLLEDGQTRFAMRAKAQAWVAVGLQPSNEEKMSPADVYACTRNDEVRRSENVSPYDSDSRDIPDNTVSDVSVNSANGVITCEFTRQPSLDGDDTFYNISEGNEYFILLAYGDNINTDGALSGAIQNNYHQGRWRTSDAQDLTKFRPITGASGAMPKAHACLMVIAWLGFGSIGIAMARYFKPVWSSSTLLGQKVWFTVHRVSMVSCVLCGIVGFILIFVDVGGFVSTVSRRTVAHAILGIIVTCFGIINPIMAAFRPHPGTPKRPIFNVAHRLVGYPAHICAVVAVFLGVSWPSLLSSLPFYVFWIMVAYIAFEAFTWSLFEILCYRTNAQCGQQTGGNKDIPMQGAGDSSQALANDDPEPPADSGVRIILLGIYVLGVIALVITMVLVIAITG